MQQQQLTAATEQFVQQELAGRDASHDFQHVERVRKLALHLATQEGLNPDSLLLIEVAALLHDVADWKYADDGAGADGSCDKARAASVIRTFLSSQQQPEPFIERVIQVVNSVGFKDELGAAGQPHTLSTEAAVVQDADRLDAIGAVGIARCFTFGGAKHRVLHDPAVPPREQLTKEAYMSDSHKATTINHFYEKLLRIKDMMKTKAGAAIAQQRHAFMEQFLQQFKLEWEGAA